jgi:hypothetical protein
MYQSSTSLGNATGDSHPLAIPSDIALSMEREYGYVISNQQSYQQARPSGPYNYPQTITFEMPSDCADFREATFQFNCSNTLVGGATFARFNQDISCIIQRLVVRFGSKVVLDIQQNNLLSCIIDETYDPQWITGGGTVMSGTDQTLANRNNDFLSQTKTYAISLTKLKNSFFDRIWPLQKCGATMYIDLYTAQPQTIIESDQPGQTYTLQNCTIHYSVLVMSPEWDQMYNEKVLNGGITFTYVAWESQIDNSVLLNNITSATKSLTYRYSSLLGILFVMQNSAGLILQSTNNKLNTFLPNNLNGLYLKVGSLQTPVYSTTNSADMYSHFCDFFGKSIYDPQYGAPLWNSSGFIGCVNTMKHPKEAREKRHSISGINVVNGVGLDLNFSFSTPIVGPQTLTTFGCYEATVTFTPNGQPILNV